MAKKGCLVEGCDRPHSAKGYCHVHYLRAKEGRPMDAPIRRRSGDRNDICTHFGCGREAGKNRYDLCNLHYRRQKRGQPMDAPKFMPRQGCVVEGCDRKHAAKGYCSLHYARLLGGRPLDTPARSYKVREKRKNDRGCTVDGCDRPHNAKGLCSVHYHRMAKGVPLDYVRPPKHGPVCTVEGCEKASRTGGLCDMHYSRKQRGAPMVPGKLPRSSGAKAPVGTRRPAGRGYFHVKTDAGWDFEHRVVMAQYLGRPLANDEQVHHINGDRSDNRIENLELWNVAQPSGQRIPDKVSHAIDILQRYAPEWVTSGM